MSSAMNLVPQNGIIEEEDEQRPSQESSSLIQQSKNPYNTKNISKNHLNNQIISTDIPQSYEQELPLEISKLLAYDESLYDLMRHKASFKYYFGRDFQIPIHPSGISSNSANMSQNEQQQQQSSQQMLLGLEHIISNYACFNSFFFPKEHLTQKSVLDIHHSQNSEKTQLLHFLISELLRDSACRSTKDSKMIPPQILLFDNTQHFDYQLLKLSIKQKIIAANYYRPAAVASTVFTQEALDSLDGLADSISEECLEKLHVIQSRSQLEFAVNIRSLKQILNTKKSIRIVIIDSLNAFFIDNENSFNYKAENDNSMMIANDDHNNSASNYKKRRKNTNTRVGLQKQYDLVIKEYLEECYNKFNRVAFIQTKRDYYKIRNLIELSDSSGSLFKANDELSNLLSNDRIFTSPHAYKSPDCSYEQTSIYTMSLDNFSNAALDKALQLLRNEQLQNGNQLNINPQKVSVVVKRNHLIEDPNDHLDEEALALHKERQQLSQFQYLMNFYCFQNNDFVPLSDNTYYF